MLLINWNRKCISYTSVPSGFLIFFLQNKIYALRDAGFSPWQRHFTKQRKPESWDYTPGKKHKGRNLQAQAPLPSNQLVPSLTLLGKKTEPSHSSVLFSPRLCEVSLLCMKSIQSWRYDPLFVLSIGKTVC